MPHMPRSSLDPHPPQQRIQGGSAGGVVAGGGGPVRDDALGVGNHLPHGGDPSGLLVGAALQVAGSGDLGVGGHGVTSPRAIRAASVAALSTVMPSSLNEVASDTSVTSS